MTTLTRCPLIVASTMLLASCSPPLQQLEPPAPTRLPAWDRLQSDHGAAAVVLSNDHRIEIVWNSGDHSLESTYHAHIAVAILDATRAREWQTWILDDPGEPGTEIEELRVSVTRPDRSVQPVSADSVRVESIGERPIRHHVTIPNFENRIVIDIWWSIFGGAGAIPCTEIPVSLPAPCERTSVAVRFPKINLATSTDVEKQRFLKDWRVVAPPGAGVGEVAYGDVLEKTWVWEDVAARTMEPGSAPDARVLVGQDTRRTESRIVFERAYTSSFIRRRNLTDISQTDLDPDSLRQLSASDRVSAVQSWLATHVRTVPVRVCVTATPEAPSRVIAGGVGDGLDVTCLAAGLLRALDVQTQLVGVRSHTSDRLDTPIVCPYFPRVVLYIPALDPERDLTTGFVNLTGLGIGSDPPLPPGPLAAVFLDGSRRYPVDLPALWSPSPTE